MRVSVILLALRAVLGMTKGARRVAGRVTRCLAGTAALIVLVLGPGSTAPLGPDRPATDTTSLSQHPARLLVPTAATTAAGRHSSRRAGSDLPAATAGPVSRSAAGPDEHHLPTATVTGPDGMPWQVLAGWSDPVQWPRRGTVVSATVTGARTRLTEQAWVHLPGAYFATTGSGPLGGARELPVTVVFTGYPGHEDNLITRQHYPQVAADAVTAGTLTPTVLVMLSPSVDHPWDTECTDIPHGPQAFTFDAEDVPDAVAARFGLHPDAYAAIGDSTGGYCAAKLESLDPGRFTAAASLSGYYRPATDPSTRGVFTDTGLRERNDLGWRLLHLPVPPVALLLATARDETGADGWATDREWFDLTRAPMTTDQLTLDHGGHNSAAWAREIPYALSWIADHLPHAPTTTAPVPAGATLTHHTDVDRRSAPPATRHTTGHR
ncbi:MAG TPA: alpha/beta hydrolase-fold protein [Sporichthyaceae bacterium]|nr:alpha/beta hydrolase-fold protein [Sporichthyaceae bacterium]